MTLRTLLLGVGLAVALNAAEPPPIPAPSDTRVIRIAGNAELAPVVARWTELFHRGHPDVRIESHLTGSDTAMAALYTGRADLALLGRTPTPSEIQGFEWVHRYKPPQVELLTGSLARPGQSPALVIFVHRDNPLRALSLAQLDAIFGTEHRLLPASLRTWGQLGVTGPAAAEPLRLYGPDMMSGTGRFFRQVVLGDSRMMNWEQLTEFGDTAPTRPASHDAGRRAVAALATDRWGIAVASLGDARDEVRPLPILVANEPIEPTRDNLVSRRYPLTRSVVGCFHRQPGKPTDALVAEFLRFALSPAGQEAAAQASAYLPVSSTQIAEKARRLD